MKRHYFFFPLMILPLVFACTEGGSGGVIDESTETPSMYLDASAEGGGGNGGGNGQPGGEAGLVTAAEWKDLDHWDFWINLIGGQEYGQMPAYWSVFTSNRIGLRLVNNTQPVVNAEVELLHNGVAVWSTRSDNAGCAELWVGAFQNGSVNDPESYKLKINGHQMETEVVSLLGRSSSIELPFTSAPADRIELAFLVDATGSMSDELEFLKADLQDVIHACEANNPQRHFLTSTVFYRDEGDDYVVRKSEFTKNLSETISFIGNQHAEGGGDFPEAVHTALHTGIHELQWSSTARSRILFLLCDAPPHYEPQIVSEMHSLIADAAVSGIKIIPISASGIDKETEFLMRFMAILTNGTYVFITDDSGIGNDHLEPSVGEYQVEKLNDLLVRLIDQYSE